MPDQEIWINQKQYENTIDKQNLLFELRYQIAFAIFTLIAVIWTVYFNTLFSQNCEKDNNFILYLPLFTGFSIIIITLWRYFVHFMNLEANGLTLSGYSYLNNLDIMESSEVSIEKFYNLNKNTKYLDWINSKSTQKQKNSARIEIWSHLWRHFDSGIIYFDKISLFVSVLCLLLIPSMLYFHLTNWTLWLFAIVDIICILAIEWSILWVEWSSYLIDEAIDKAKAGVDSHDFSRFDLLHYRFR